jgi:rhamnosyltransferase
VVSIVIPTYNASRYLDVQLRALRAQTVKDLDILVIDSSSSDETLDIAKQYAIQTVTITKEEFDHGGTRTLAGKTRSVGDILVYLTQDALPCDDRAIETLIQPLLAEQICGAAFGRQIPYQDATPFAQHLRLFNYPPQSYIRTYADRAALGIRAAFCSNSFAAYRRDWLAVDDHCAGIEHVLSHGQPGTIYKVGGGSEKENLTVAEQELKESNVAMIRILWRRDYEYV